MVVLVVLVFDIIVNAGNFLEGALSVRHYTLH